MHLRLVGAQDSLFDQSGNIGVITRQLPHLAAREVIRPTISDVTDDQSLTVYDHDLGRAAHTAAIFVASG
jgi:hypothetical protein